MDDPIVYAAGIAKALQDYPEAIVMECCDTKHGLPRRLERRPTPKQVIDWCSNQMAYHRMMAAYTPRPPKPPEPVYSPEYRQHMLGRLGALAKELRERLRERMRRAWEAPTDDELRARYGRRDIEKERTDPNG